MVQPGDVGMFTEAGLPNITGSFSSPKQLNANYNLSTADGAFYSKGQGGASNSIRVPETIVTDYQAVAGFSAANSNPIYGNSTTVQPPAIGAKLYIQVFTSTVPASMAQAGEFINMLESYLPLSGGTMAGNVFWNKETGFGIRYSGNSGTFGWGYGECTGSGIAFRGVDYHDHPGSFYLFARDATNTAGLNGHVDGTLLWNGQSVLNPIGTIIAFAGNSAPAGYIICNGAAVSRTTYAKLFAIIGTTYGTGNGSTTFNLPNLTNKFIMGSGTAGTSKAAGLPNITGGFTTKVPGNHVNYAVGAFNGSHATNTSNTTTAASYSGSGTSTWQDTNRYGFVLNASKSSSIYGASTTVQPPALTMRFYIKF